MTAENFTIIRPVALTDARLTSSTVAEPSANDPAAWAAATAYVAGDRVHRVTTHMVYQRLVNGTTPTAPEDDTLNWVAVEPTDRWKMFDASNTTQTVEADGTMVIVVTPGTVVDSIAFDNVDADSIQVQVAGSSYDRTVSLKTRECRDWWQYFFEPFSYRTAAVFTGLPLLVGNQITITVAKASGDPVKVGTCVMGLSKKLGTSEHGVGLGIIDFSGKDTDAFGNVFVVERAFSKRMTVDVFIANAQLDDVYSLLASYRARPVVWVGAGNLYGSMLLYGFYKSFEIVVEYPEYSWLRLDIESLA